MLTKSNTLQLFDIYPKVVPVGREVTLHIRRLDLRLLGDEHYVKVMPVNRDFRGCFAPKILPLLADGTGEDKNLFSVTCVFPDEQEYQIRLVNKQTDKQTALLRVYALEEDLLNRKPLVGDLHCHTSYSDGREGPEFVAAQYRQNGFDFLAITDHRRYQPSGMAKSAYERLELPFKLYRGEEVHTPGNYVHIVNFGGDHSVNAVALEKKSMEEWRDTTGEPEWLARVEALAATLEDVPEGVDPKVVASNILIAQEIREGGGLCILAHPHWLQSVRNVCDSLTEKLLGDKIVDALELIGGQSWYENLTQTALYYDMVQRGIDIPIVGSSDSHGTLCLHTGEPQADYHMFTEERTLVFARENTREAIIDAVKAHQSLAIQIYEGQYPYIYGPYRLVQYATFLLMEYFPLRDDLYFEEGRLMHEFAAGVPGAEEKLLRKVQDDAYFEEKYMLR